MTNENGNMIMPVAPYGGNGGFGGGFGSDWGWIILLLLCCWCGFGGGFGGYGGADIYPWMNQADITTSGFQNLQTNNAVSSLQNSVTSGFGDVQTALCGGFAGVVSRALAYFLILSVVRSSLSFSTVQTDALLLLPSLLANSSCDKPNSILLCLIRSPIVIRLLLYYVDLSYNNFQNLSNYGLTNEKHDAIIINS